MMIIRTILLLSILCLLRASGSLSDQNGERFRSVDRSSKMLAMNIRTSRSGSLPGIPQNVTAEATGIDEITIKWTPSTDVTVNYRILYRIKGSSSVSTIFADENIGQFILMGIDGNSEYEVKLVASNYYGLSEPTPWISVSNQKETDIPGKPRSFRLRALNNAIGVYWAAPEDQSIKVNGYILRYGKDLTTRSITLGAGSRYYVIEDLKPSNYVVTLRAFNDIGMGENVLGSIQLVAPTSTNPTPGPMMPPVAVGVNATGPNTAVISWVDPSHGRAEAAKAFIIRYASARSRCEETVDASPSLIVQKFEVTNLKPDSSYEFQVQGISDHKKSTWSFSQTIKTPKL